MARRVVVLAAKFEVQKAAANSRTDREAPLAVRPSSTVERGRFVARRILPRSRTSQRAANRVAAEPDSRANARIDHPCFRGAGNSIYVPEAASWSSFAAAVTLYSTPSSFAGRTVQSFITNRRRRQDLGSLSHPQARGGEHPGAGRPTQETGKVYEADASRASGSKFQIRSTTMPNSFSVRSARC